MASRKATDKKMKETKGAEHEYNAQGAPEMGEAMDEEAGMHKGGKAKKRMKRRAGGKAEGEKPKHRADKKSRGGRDHMAKGGHEHHKRAAGGRTPYTSGHNTEMPSEGGKTNTGHESQRPN